MKININSLEDKSVTNWNICELAERRMSCTL